MLNTDSSVLSLLSAYSPGAWPESGALVSAIGMAASVP